MIDVKAEVVEITQDLAKLQHRIKQHRTLTVKQKRAALKALEDMEKAFSLPLRKETA